MPTSIAVAVIGAIAAIAGSFFTSRATADVRVNTIDTKVQVLEERQSLQYTEVKDSLSRIESKLDGLTTLDKVSTKK